MSRVGRHPNAIFFVDFDGTAAQDIASNRLLDRFARDGWRQIDDRLDRGEITFKECILEVFALLDGTRAEMAEFSRREFQLRSGFHRFISHCRARSYRVEILSEALDFMIGEVLSREGLSRLPVYADHAVFEGERVAQVELPHERGDCRCGLGICKGGLVRERIPAYVRSIYIGDGSNDLCGAREADLIFARRRLAELCEQEGLSYHPFEDFHDVMTVLASEGL